MKKLFYLVLFFSVSQTIQIVAQTTHYLSNGRVIYEADNILSDITSGDSMRILKNNILIKFSSGTSESKISMIEDSNHLVREYSCMTGWVIYQVPDTNLLIDLVSSLLPQIDSSKFSFNYPLTFFSSIPLDQPDDPEYYKQWYLENISIPEAWQITTGNPGIKIGILDNGADWNNQDLYHDTALGYNFIYGGGGAYTYPSSWKNFHGTLMSSIIAAKTNNQLGQSGIAGGWNSPPLKIAMYVIGDAWPQLSKAAGALDYALKQGVRLFNFSWGVEQYPGECDCGAFQTLKAEIDTAYDLGATMFSSTGNYPTSPKNGVAWPGCSTKAIAVGATDGLNNRWEDGNEKGSQWGIYTDISAPGENILGPLVTGDPQGPPNGSLYQILYGGTSCATAIAVGVTALMQSVNPCLANSDVEYILKHTADTTGNYTYNWDTTRPGHSQELGYGKINAYNAVRMASEYMDEIPEYQNIVFDKPMWFTHNLTLLPTSTLTIRSTVKFNEGCKIIVKPGAKLIVDGGTLTTSCTGFWQGIEVHGNRDLPQTPVSNQGYVSIVNGGKIEKANPGIYSTNGGIVIAEDAVFENNQRAAIFANYNGLNFSTFRRCSFKISNEAGIQGNPYFIGAELVKTIRVIGCTFENTVELNKMAYRFRGMGIVSLDADILIAADIQNQPLTQGDTLRTMFKNLAYGLYCLHSGVQSSINVYDAVFDHNQKGAYLSGYQRSSYVSILRSKFIVLDPGQPEDGELVTYGVYLDRCSGYSIEENNFSCAAEIENGYGLIINESGPFVNEVYNNAFHNLKTGSQAQGSNRYSYPSEGGLCYKCNDFYLNRNDIMVVSDAPPGTPDQGICLYQGTKSKAAKNTFSLSNFGGYDINNPFDQIEYWIDENSGGHNTTPDPIIGVKNSTISLSPYNKTDDCPSRSSGTPDISVLHEKKEMAESDADSLQIILTGLIDGGSTGSLTTLVEQSTPTVALETTVELLEKSPFLSDTVISLAISREEILPNAMIRDILVENPQSAKSDALMEALEERLVPMPDSLMAVILEGQETQGLKEEMENDLSELNQRFELSMKQLIQYYHEDSTGNYGTDSVLSLINGINKLYSVYDAISLYYTKESFSDGNNLLSSIPSTYTLSTDQENEYEMYETLFPIVHQLISDSSGLESVDSNQVETLLTLTGNTHELPGVYARNILIKRGIVQYEEPILTNILTKESRNWKIKKPEIKPVTDGWVSVFPNPSNGYFIAEYQLPKGSANDVSAALTVTDLNGRNWYSRKVQKSYDQVVIPVSGMAAGTYVVHLTRNGISLGNTKLVIQK